MRSAKASTKRRKRPEGLTRAKAAFRAAFFSRKTDGAAIVRGCASRRGDDHVGSAASVVQARGRQAVGRGADGARHAWAARANFAPYRGRSEGGGGPWG